MKLCADTWFLLLLSEKEPRSLEILRGVISGKDELIVPMIVISETYRKLFERGTHEKVIESIFDELEQINKVQFIPIDKQIAIETSKVSFSFKVPLIDSVVVATSKLLRCHFLLGKDEDFKLLQKKGYVRLKYW